MTTAGDAVAAMTVNMLSVSPGRRYGHGAR